MATEEMAYSEITDPQERMMLFNVYVIGSMGILLSIQMLYSLSKTYKKLNDDQDIYYIYAVIFGITLTICSTLFFLIRLLSNDLILPIDQLFTNHIGIMSMIDSIIILLWLMIKICLYFGFTFIYLSIFEKERVDVCLRILMTFITICTVIYMIEYLINDLMSVSSEEICLTSKRGIYIINVVIMYTSSDNNHISMSIMLTAFVAFLTDFVYIFTLLYRFIANAATHEKYYFQGIKGMVLICISSIVPISTAIITVFNLNLQYLLGNMQVLIDIICLFLMFNRNETMYNELCGCLFNPCCGRICFGNRYKTVTMEDDSDDGEDEDDDEEDNDPSFML